MGLQWFIRLFNKTMQKLSAELSKEGKVTTAFASPNIKSWLDRNCFGLKVGLRPNGYVLLLSVCLVGNVLFDVDVFSDSYVDVWFSRRIDNFIGFASQIEHQRAVALVAVFYW